MTLNERAQLIADEAERNATRLRVHVTKVAGARVIDCGGAVQGSLAAGLLLARACLADAGEVAYVPYPVPEIGGPAVQVTTDDPVRACLASQYAGWQVTAGKFFAMGSGPMRALAAREEIFQHISAKEESPFAVGVLETHKHPTEEVIAAIVAKLPLVAEHLTLLVAPTSSIAGTTQIVARSVETALHKLHELKFDVNQVVSGYGIAPLPPVATDFVQAIGRTNDAILYGAKVVLWVRADDEVIEHIGPKVPSAASKDHGSPFAEVFARYNGDFYKIDPLLFSPAEIEFRNLKTGRCHRFGRSEPNLLRKSFGLGE
ncbi:n -methenyltetrahydromethanopterin cyclohydrolase : Methenyltetrahydromethanopterin cyclohydrolase OS=Singulisphaera acidiphila (strain ATCC BAA-1392 / DSM 18658 / VKM B-2454 / MOB10) GN=Sinac_1236 PE=4 SV=1: MCH [Gemmata massiliana]|uniref:Methenyltetrahydromethanopterin cyclohydrolase n=1 Tax=Gemmata massiliana TaxID=1210884 RepID=A0A6P2D6N3_9BACT|nr:methenyltetrahydromethanopterin cyclohydrolase [Gemmata massiliana]VTR96587.1 n -methenyltetrahydromethanopterin cyclohydrolase : Methenyltetrahydromethanopterin cyclohydrolase OS=Singulisphaera acidiphila (strain ATCC BAA-1392 / DSM 18658 / VKM B-2454 / MOB10) GN=Sinac_1236 PE=4 SV=1: MCH [Gemmata massiliana]